MIEDIDICVGFQHSVDESGFGHKDGDTGENGEDDGNIADWGETLHFWIAQISQFISSFKRGGEARECPSYPTGSTKGTVSLSEEQRLFDVSLISKGMTQVRSY